MPTDSTTIKQVRVIFPDGLPRGLDPSQVKLVVRNPEGKIDQTADAQHNRDANEPAADTQPAGAGAKQNREGNRAAANDRAADQSPQHNREANEPAAAHPTATLPAQHGKNEPEPVAAGACPATPPSVQGDSVRLPSASPSRLRPSPPAPSSQNALKHGLSSRRIVTGEEDEQEWLEFQAECRQTLEPIGAIEIGYADEFAASRWRLQRCLGIETSIFDQQFAMQKIYRAKECATMDGIDKTGMAFKSAKDDLTALGRYETRIRRSGERALANLQKLQSIRQNKPNEPARSGADSLVCEPAPKPVQPSASSASIPPNEPSAASADIAAGACPPTETPEAKRTQATGHNPAVPPNEPSAPSADEAARVCPPTKTPEAKRTQATGHNPALPLPSAFGILHSSSATAPVREPTPNSVQPSASSASVLRNEPNNPPLTPGSRDSL